MKFTKQKFKSVFSTVGALLFTVCFGVGHLIACNSSSNITKPVITVPVSSNNVLNPNINGSVDGVWFSNSFDHDFVYDESNVWITLSPELKLIDNVLYADVLYEYPDLVNGDYFTGTESFEIANVVSFTSNLGLKITYQMDLPQIISPGVFDDYVFKITLSFTVNDVITNCVISHGYLYNEIPSFIAPTTIVDDYYSRDFVNFVFFELPRAYNDARQNGIDYVLNHLDEYNLYTYDQYIAYGQQQRELGNQESANVLSVSGMIREIFRAPISMFQNAFNFVLPLPDGTSLNVGGILTFFLTIGIALTIVSLITKIGGK